MKAWLITWKPTQKFDKKCVATILNYHMSGENVKNIMLQIYIDNEANLAKRIAYAKSKRNQPYFFRVDKINGIPWCGRMTCGYNPYLYARQVKNLQIKYDNLDNEYLEWEEIEKPNIKPNE